MVGTIYTKRVLREKNIFNHLSIKRKAKMGWNRIFFLGNCLFGLSSFYSFFR